MKLAAPFRLNYKWNDRIDEFNIDYVGGKSTVDDVIAFANKFSGKEINVLPLGSSTPGEMLSIGHACDNVKIRLPPGFGLSPTDAANVGVRTFYDFSMPAYNLRSLHAMLASKVSCVYVADDLMHDLWEVRALCDKAGVELRVVANRVATTKKCDGLAMTDVALRPDDFDMLSRCVDIIEFDCYGKSRDDFNWGMFDVTASAWLDKHTWAGDLCEINRDVRYHVMNQMILPKLNDMKVRCKSKCMLHDGECHLCDDAYELSCRLQRKNIRFTDI